MNVRTPGSVLVAAAVALACPGAPAQSVEGTFAGLGGDVVRATAATLGALPTGRRSVGLRVAGAVAAPARAAVEASIRATVTVPADGRVELLTTGDTLDAAVAAARAASQDVLVWVTLAVEAGGLSAQVTVLRVQDSLWDTLLLAELPPPTTLQTVVLSRRVDAAARAVLGATTVPDRWPAVPIGRPRVVATPFHGTVAMAAGDLDADGRDELVLVTTDRVRVGRLTGVSLAFLPDRGAGWVGGMGLAASPPRQPLGTAVYDPMAHRVTVRTSTARTAGVVSLTRGELTVTALAGGDGYPAQGYGCVAVSPAGEAVTVLQGNCTPVVGTPVVGLAAGVVAVPVSDSRADGAGVIHRVEVLADGAGGAEVRVDGAHLAALTDVAPPLALADLDADGRVELLSASGSEPEGPDRLRVFTVGPTGVQERQGWNVPGPVEALAVGDLDGDGWPEVVVAAVDLPRHVTTLWVLP